MALTWILKNHVEMKQLFLKSPLTNVLIATQRPTPCKHHHDDHIKEYNSNDAAIHVIFYVYGL